MKMISLKKILLTVLIGLIMVLGAFPSFAVSSPVSTQTVTIRVPETNAISTGYGTSGDSQMEAMDVSPDNTETAIGNLYVQSCSNSNTQLWVRASGDFMFGVLHFIGVAIILSYPFLKRRYTNLVVGILCLAAGIYLQTVYFDFSWANSA